MQAVALELSDLIVRVRDSLKVVFDPVVGRLICIKDFDSPAGLNRELICAGVPLILKFFALSAVPVAPEDPTTSTLYSVVSASVISKLPPELARVTQALLFQ